MTGKGLVKVRFHLPPAEWHQYQTEGLWAEKVDAERDIFILLNSPFRMEGVSHSDVVAATLHPEDGFYDFSHVVARGGHSTYLILVSRDQDGFGERADGLEALGCSFEATEHGEDVLFSVDVPDTADIHAVYAALEEGELAGIWRFQESHVGHDLTPPRQGH